MDIKFITAFNLSWVSIMEQGSDLVWHGYPIIKALINADLSPLYPFKKCTLNYLSLKPAPLSPPLRKNFVSII